MNKKHFWALMAALACTVWGISGLFAKALFNVSPLITPMWLSQVRMISSGIILLIAAGCLGQHPLACLHDKKDAATLVAYGILGLLPVQLFYFVVVQQANASVATILQFVGPFFVLAYMTMTHQQILRRVDILAAIGAFIGVFLLATHGNVSQLQLTPSVLFWGLLSAVGVATNTLIPIRVLDHISSLVVTGWGLLLAGLSLLLVHPHMPAIPNQPQVWISVLGVIIIGTLIPFQLMMNSLRFIQASTASLLDAFEPLSAMVGSVICFNLHLTAWDLVGSFLVIICALALNIKTGDRQKIKKSHT